MKRILLLFISGAACFVISQPLLRIPLLNYLQSDTEFILFYRMNSDCRHEQKKSLFSRIQGQSGVRNPSQNRTITMNIRRDDNLLVNHKKIRRMMRDMGVYTIYPKPNLGQRYHAQYIRPYLLRNLDITHPDQVWELILHIFV